jgi:hypothetical protein
MNNQNWKPIQTPLYPWTRSFEKIISSYALPDLSGTIIYAVSDYGGSHETSKYQTVSVLFVDLDNSRNWEVQRRQIRQKYLTDGRRLSFKGLNDRLKQNALVPFLTAADSIRGVSVTLVISKAIDNLYLLKKDVEVACNSFGLESRWKYNSLETAIRVAHLVSVLTAGLSKENQEVYWISDEDELFANVQKTQDLQKIIGKLSAISISHKLSTLGMGTTVIDEGDRFEEDLTAIPDLIAGAMSEVANKLSQFTGGRIPSNLAVPFSGKFSTKTDIISSWIWSKNEGLPKVIIVIEKHGKGFTTFRLDMTES